MPLLITPKLARPALVILPAVIIALALGLGCRNAVAAARGADDAAMAAVAVTHDVHDAQGTVVPASEARAVDGPEEALAAGSLHDLEITWRDQDDRPLTIAELGGRPLVMAMIYTTCAHTCPLIMADLKQLEGALTPAQRAGMSFVLVSLDPQRDTPAQLRTFAADARLDPTHWTLLAGTGTDVRMLAAALGVRYRPGEAGEIAHSNALTIVDASGAIAYRQRGVGGGSDAALRALVRLLP